MQISFVSFEGIDDAQMHRKFDETKSSKGFVARRYLSF
jgi:hypothetical protein